MSSKLGFKGELPEGRHMRIDNKKFYFDIGQNNLGIYMRISEVRPTHTLLFAGLTAFMKFRSKVTSGRR